MRRKHIGLKASNVLLSAGIVAMFMYLLVLAMAQDQVMAKLSRSAEFNNYSASLIDARKAKETAELIAKRAKERETLRAQIAAAESGAAMAELLYEREAGRLRPVFAALEGTRGCGITRKPVVAVDGLTDQETEMKITQVDLTAARACFDFDVKLGGERRGHYLATLANAKRLSDEALRTEMERKKKVHEGKMLQAEINRIVHDWQLLAPTRVHFTVLDPLEFDWLPKFVNYPPFIIHVLLSFFSGTFGALLITMVFVVYPSKLRERVSAKLYYKRVFLGGLVAVTVFIVFTGGASILGTSEVSQDNTNVMSFTAIGLLAGMFSDTVADWLSVRAKTMFRTEADEDDAKDPGDEDADGKNTRPGTAA